MKQMLIELEATRLRWQAIADAGGCTVANIPITLGEAHVAVGVMDWVIERVYKEIEANGLSRGN